MPIDEGTFIINLVHNYLININEKYQKRCYMLDRHIDISHLDSKEKELRNTYLDNQVSYGKRILHLPDNMD